MGRPQSRRSYLRSSGEGSKWQHRLIRYLSRPLSRAVLISGDAGKDTESTARMGNDTASHRWARSHKAWGMVTCGLVGSNQGEMEIVGSVDTLDAVEEACRRQTLVLAHLESLLAGL
jgi:hypothetical protein